MVPEIYQRYQKYLLLLVTFVVLSSLTTKANAFIFSFTGSQPSVLKAKESDEEPTSMFIPSTFLNRRSVASAIVSATLAGNAFLPKPTFAKCTDIESCREIGERKVEKDMKENPTTVLNSGVRYKVLRPGTGDNTVQEGSSVDLIYSISEGGGAYMYSKGFGYEKVDIGGKLQSDLGLDSLRVVVGRKNVPVGIEQALVGMKRGEKRRIELPPSVGFETSNWQPEPTSRRGKASITGYQRILTGFGSQPPFPAVTIWDIEVLSTRN
mmetsp:Transcript_22450/g.29506  ORF Transcript_22450/g.29506 Transcript_22450/m.29506 type:complete len:266 (+) Transcript_22450:21-818(+)